MAGRLLLLLLAIAVMAFSGCSGEKEEKAGSAQLDLHGVGKCDQCHEAYPVKDIAAGLHKAAFDKQPDIHKRLCSECHDVNSFCGQCHEVPDAVK
ncbi:hypothetical protein GAH_01700 [Geoglobus ahangari]|uniref:Uncharacterized protein n=1 Tax=Geoglobus ahangari TaxID=113653 RepID=A0A0F7DBF8_9EURY|nr:hypothetical protein [Geoglobus ahangari]AKG91016.1 hypothetical protein GAH_01700 [Geoglobus ahangari]